MNEIELPPPKYTPEELAEMKKKKKKRRRIILIILPVVLILLFHAVHELIHNYCIDSMPCGGYVNCVICKKQFGGHVCYPDDIEPFHPDIN